MNDTTTRREMILTINQDLDQYERDAIIQAVVNATFEEPDFRNLDWRVEISNLTAIKGSRGPAVRRLAKRIKAIITP